MSGAKTAKEYVDFLVEAANVVTSKLGRAPVAMVLGSGVNDIIDELENPKELSYSEIPHMPLPKVHGHIGKLIHGSLNGRSLFCFAGRVHQYEGHNSFLLTFAARLMAVCGVRIWLATNAAGGAVTGAEPPFFILLKDTLNNTNRNPLADTVQTSLLPNASPSMSGISSPYLMHIAKLVANREGIDMYDGIYAWSMGPTYESAAETRALYELGANAFGMSTVPELHAAYCLGMEVAAVSVCTNLSSALSPTPLGHEEVGENAAKALPLLKKLVMGILTELDYPMLENRMPAGLLEVSEQSVNVSLELPYFPLPTASTIADAVKFVAPSVQTKDKELECVVLSPGFDKIKTSILKSSSEWKSFALKNLPAFPVHSETSKTASISFGSTDKKSIALIDLPKMAGLEPHEAEYIFALLHKLGFRTLIHTFLAAASTHENEQAVPVPRLTKLQDILHFRPVLSRPDSQILPFVADPIPISQHVDEEEFEKKKKNSKVQPATLLAFNPPSFPTAFEIAFAARLGADVVTSANLAAFQLARDLGWRVGGLVSVATFADALVGGVCAQDTMVAGSACVFDDGDDELDVIDRMSSSFVAPRKDSELVSITPQIVVPPRSQKIIQADINDIKSAVEMLKKHFNNVKSVDRFLVMLGGTGEFVMPLVEGRFETILGRIHLSKLPGCSKFISETSNGMELVIGKLGDKVIGIFQQNVPVWSEIDLHLQTFISRVCVLAWSGPMTQDPVQATNVPPFMFVSYASSCTSDISPGEIALVTDFINLTGDSALCGLNEWGLRFPPVSDVLPHSRTGSVVAVAKKNSCPIRDVIAGLTAGSDQPSDAEAHRVTTWGGDVIIKDAMHEAYAVHTMGGQVTLLTLIKKWTKFVEGTVGCVSDAQRDGFAKFVSDIMAF